MENSSPPPPPEMDVSTIFQNDDANEDGVLSVEETKLTEEMFADADSDSDGLLTTEEVEEMLGAMGGPGMMKGPPPGGAPDIDAIFEEEDKDGDGMISVQDSALSSEMFSNIDGDGDGYITTEEIENSLPASDAQKTGQTSAFVQDPNTFLAMAAYHNAMQSITGVGAQTFLSSLSICMAES